MAKYTRNTINSGYTTAEINAELEKVKLAIDDQLDKKGGSGNQMSANLDMNSNHILNAKDVSAQTLSVNGVQVVSTSELTNVNAIKLATARNINGTAFDGTADITTANWGTGRTLTLGDTGKAVNGSANVAWTRTELGITKPNIDALGINAATLDSLDSSQFVRSDANDLLTGRYVIRDALGSDFLKLQDTGATGSGANPFISYLDSEATRLGYVGFASIADNDLFLNSDAGAVRLYYASALKLKTTTTGIAVTGEVTSTSYNTSSDMRLKEFIANYDELNLAKLNAKWYVKNGKKELGYFAQEAEKYVPEAVKKTKTDIFDDEYHLNYQMIHTAKIAELELKIARLEKLLDAK